MRILFLFLVLLFAACPEQSCDSPSSPTTTTVPPACQWDPALPASSDECRSPRVDIPFSWDAYQGIVAFGLGHEEQSKEDVLSYVSAAMSRGRNTFEICSEAEWWDEGSAELPQKVRDVARLQWTLDLIARVPGAQVALIGNCTLKRQVNLDEQFIWAQVVAEIVTGKGVSHPEWGYVEGTMPFRNVAIFTHNEFDNCAGRTDWGGNKDWCAGKDEVGRHIRMYREAGIQYVTADDSFTRDPARTRGMPESQVYGFRLANKGAWPASFHPDRERLGQPWDPSLEDLQKLARYNGTFVLSETVAYSEDAAQCDGLSTCDQARIEELANRCAVVPECHLTFHCRSCLAGVAPSYIPEAR